jgi:PelA/Pel-15E family pectate lyase
MFIYNSEIGTQGKQLFCSKVTGMFHKVFHSLNRWVFRITVVFCPAIFLFSNLEAQTVTTIEWKQAFQQKESWYSGPEAIRIADNVLLHQHDNGGWLKNIDMAKKLKESEMKQLREEKSKDGTTIDNDATISQMHYLGRMYQNTGLVKYKEGFLRGLDFLLDAQYDSGGWPQYYPIRKGYYEHITFNDGAMIGVMRLLKDVGQGKAPFTFVDTEQRVRAIRATEKGLEVILKAQISVDGELTAWCAQHDRNDLSPQKARTYELPSISGGESVAIIQYLMAMEEPRPEVVRAIEGAMAWLEKVKISGIRLEKKEDSSLPKGYDVVVVEDPTASPLWGRFYEIGTNRPMFVGRDGIVRYKLAEIEHERRVGYSYLVTTPKNLFEKDYPRWKRKRLMSK